MNTLPFLTVLAPVPFLALADVGCHALAFVLALMPAHWYAFGDLTMVGRCQGFVLAAHLHTHCSCG